MSLFLHKKQPIFLERDSVVLGDFVAYSFQYCAGFSVIFRIEGDDARIHVKENLDVGNVYQFSLGVPRYFSCYFIHDLFVFQLFRSIILEVCAVCEFAMERSFSNKANPFI